MNAGVTIDPVSGLDAIAFVARGSSVKLAHLRRRPYANVTFRASWEWVAVEGATTVVGPDDPATGVATDADVDADGLPHLLRDVFIAAGGTHDDWDEYDRVMAEDRRVAVFVGLDRITSNV